MNFKDNKVIKIAGLIVFMVLIFNLSKVVFGNLKEIKGKNKDINFVLGQKSGVIHDSIMHDGKVYLSYSTAGELFGKNAVWDKENGVLYIEDGLGIYMSDVLEAYYKEIPVLGEYKSNALMTMGGQDYFKGYKLAHANVVSYNLEGNYSSITGLIGLEDGDNYSDATVDILGDGKLLKQVNLKAGDLPTNMDVNVIGVSKLEIKVTYPQGRRSTVDLVNVYIK